jgi:phosphatidylglycerol---prolipoprotein diacylglyceryl transferase
VRRVLFRWRGFTVWSYPAMVYLGFIGAVVTGNLAAHAAGLDAFRVYVAMLVLAVPALIGARLFFVATHWDLYRGDVRQIWNRHSGGAAQYGGFLVVLPVSVPLLGALGLPIGAFWDVAVFGLLVLMIFGRAGCLLNGCCAGRPSHSWISLNLRNDAGVWARRVPTQCLEAAWALIILVLAVAERRAAPFPGALFLLVVAAYAAGRLPLESSRERQPAARPFTIHHAISVALLAISLAVLVAGWLKR